MVTPVHIFPHVTPPADMPENAPESPTLLSEQWGATPFRLAPVPGFTAADYQLRNSFYEKRSMRLRLFQELFLTARTIYLDSEFKRLIQDRHPDWRLQDVKSRPDAYAAHYAYEITLPRGQKIFLEKYEGRLVIEFREPYDREVIFYDVEDDNADPINHYLRAIDVPGTLKSESGHHISVYNRKLARWSPTIVLDSQPSTLQVSRFLRELVQAGQGDWESTHEDLFREMESPGSTFEKNSNDLSERLKNQYRRSNIPDLPLYYFEKEDHGGKYLYSLGKSALGRGYKPAQILSFKFQAPDGETTFGKLLEQQRFRLVLAGGNGFPLMHYRKMGEFGLPRRVDQDSYQLLLLLMRLTPKQEWQRSWKNFDHDDLSLDLILQEVDQAYYRENFYFDEHDAFHFIEVLIPYYRGTGRDLNKLKQRFLERETKAPIDPHNVTIVAHRMESLGLLLNAPEIRWTPEEQRQVRDWIAEVNRWTARANLTELLDSEVIHLYRGYALLQQSSQAWAKK